MSTQVTVKPGYTKVFLPNGKAYDAGQSVVLSTAEYARVTPGLANLLVIGATTTDPAAAETSPVSLGNSAWDAGNIESVARTPGFGDMPLTSGRLWVQGVTAPRNSQPITTLGYSTRATAPAGVTLARMALFTVADDGGITKVAQTAPFTPVGTYYPQNYPLSTAGGFPASYTCLKGLRYSLGLLVVGATPGEAQGAEYPSFKIKPDISRFAEAQSDIAASYTDAQLAIDYRLIHLYGLRVNGTRP